MIRLDASELEALLEVAARGQRGRFRLAAGDVSPSEVVVAEVGTFEVVTDVDLLTGDDGVEHLDALGLAQVVASWCPEVCEAVAGEALRARAVAEELEEALWDLSRIVASANDMDEVRREMASSPLGLLRALAPQPTLQEAMPS